MAAQREVMITFFSAFAGFSAFGAVIATFLASSNALPRLAASWGGHGHAEARQLPLGPDRDRAELRAGRRRRVVIWSAAGGIGLAALVSCLGLCISFLWLRADARGVAAGWGGAYRWTGYLLLTEVLLITVITLLAAGSAAWYAVVAGPRSGEFITPFAQAAVQQGHIVTSGAAQSTCGPAETQDVSAAEKTVAPEPP
jgi:hypothetical protein